MYISIGRLILVKVSLDPRMGVRLHALALLRDALVADPHAQALQQSSSLGTHSGSSRR